ncbi:MAG: O-antigen ligase family protein [Chlamydiae bacterium]|nr:O-antigen ligase family protein [Chlamydiota bacterium]
MVKKITKEIIILGIVFLFISLSNFYGIMIHGWNENATFYAIRLITLIFSGYVLGKISFYLYGKDVKSLLDFYLKCYFILALIGFAIFILFPDSSSFWIFLEKYHIQYVGDPHFKRFISPYFDPNFYGIIACIPFIFSLSLGQFKKEFKYQFLSWFFLVSLILTGSRSGIGSFLILLFYLFFNSNNVMRILRNLKLTLILVIMFIVIVVWNLSQTMFFLERSINIHADPSATSRFSDFQFGVEIFKNYPIFGLGYNYLILFTREHTGLSALHSSILVNLISFGVIFFSIIMAIFIVWWINLNKKCKKLKKDDLFISQLGRRMLFYLLIVVFFSSQFNHCLFYPFWLIPMIALFTYLSSYANESLKNHSFRISE